MSGNSFDDGEFRNDCAAFVKFLLVAREKNEPGFLTAELRESWDPHQQFSDSDRSAAEYLKLAKRKLKRIDVRYSEPGGSIGIGEVEDSSVAELQLDISFLVQHEDGLVDAIRDLEAEQTIDWNALVDWAKLPAIRAALNQLPADPSPSPAPVAQSERVQLFKRSAVPVAIVDGVDVNALTEPRYNVVQALLQAGEDGHTKDSWDVASGHTESRKIAKRLANKHPHWAAVLDFPGKTGGRYRIK
jgi:hypothetical protein